MYSKSIRQTNFIWFLIQKSSLKIWIFRVFLPPKEALMASFSKTGTPISRIYVAEKGLIILSFLSPQKTLVAIFNETLGSGSSGKR